MNVVYTTMYCPKCKFATERAKCPTCGGNLSYEKPNQDEIDLAQYKQLLANPMLQCVHSAKFDNLKVKFGEL